MVLRTAAQRLRDAAQALFVLYEKHPYTANSIVGAAMFTAGELSVQYNICGVGGAARSASSDASEDTDDGSGTSSSKGSGDAEVVVDWPKVTAIGALGAVQNGVFAVMW